ncbi:MAG: type III restriction endonuclease subunit R, partial [Alistipes sp.]|nr:type III restriction endonuclease subunit R [Alistipes sp.]
ITVNALKEGWDCPFAYILASLANKTSRVDVEQILGRVLRLPYTTKHRDDLLNLSYVFTSSADFRATIENIIDSLNRAGFSKKDYRVAEVVPAEAQPQPNNSIGLFDNPEEHPDIPATNDVDELPQIDTEAIKNATSNPAFQTTVELEIFAQQESENYDKQMEATAQHDDGIPNDLKDMVDQYPIKEFFREEAAKIVLPIFVKRVNQGSIFEEEGAYVQLEKSMLNEGFDLDKQDHNIDFTRADVEAVRVDLAKVGNDEYRPERFNLSSKQLAVIKEHFISLPPEAKKEQLAAAIAKNIRFDEIAEPQIARYIKDAIKDFDSEQIADLYTYEPQTTAAIRNKIGELLGKHQKEVFKKWLDTGQIKCESRYKLPETMTLRTISKGLSKGLYTEEGDMNDWE